MTGIKKNIIYNFIYQILILILPFITAPYLSRTIGANGLGIYSFSHTVALYFTYITLLGLNNYGNRTIAAVQNDINQRSVVFWEIYFMQITTFLISAILYVIYILFFSIDKMASIIMLTIVFSSAFDINWFFFGIEQFKLTVTRNTIIKILSVICIFIFVKDANDVYKYIIIMASFTLLSQIALWPYLKKFVYFKKISWVNVKKHYRPNLKLFISVIAVSLYKLMDKIMLGYMSDFNEVGMYENAEKIITMIQSLIVAVGTVMLPRMSAIISSTSGKNEEKRYFDVAMNLVIIYSFATLFGLIAIKDDFVNLYFGKGFEKTGILIGYLAVTIMFFGIGNVLRTQYLIPKKLDNIYIKSAILGAILNLIINFLLIPKLHSLGATIGTIIAEISVCIYQFWGVRREIKLKKYCNSFIYYGIAGVTMLVIIKLLPKVEMLFLSLVIDILVGIIVYIIFLVIRFVYLKKDKKTFIV